MAAERSESIQVEAEPEGIPLSDAEAAALAVRCVAEWCRHGDHPEWEDLPMLGEHAFGRLCEQMVKVAEMLDREAAACDRMYGIDSLDLMRRARDDAAPSGRTEATDGR